MNHYARALLLLIVVLSGCQATEPGPLTVPEQAGIQVENWSAAAATITAQIYGDKGPVGVATGTVSGSGLLTFSLGPVSTSQLSSFAACPNVTVSDSGLRLGTFSAFEVSRRKTSIGQLAQASGLEVTKNGLQKAGDYYLQYTYADRNVDISGRCQGGIAATFSYALTLQKGWNPVVFRLLEPGVLELSTEPVPAEAAWFFDEGRP